MRTHIEGGWVVAFNGASHEVHEQGSVVFENDRIVHAGGRYAGPADARIDARGRLVTPGFINAHVHPAGSGGDYLLLDMAKSDYRTANYMSFAAPLKGKMTPPPPAATAALRTFVFLHTLKNGTTTNIDVGGLRGDWEGYARLIDDLGVRVYGGPPFRDRDTFMDARGRLTYEEDAALGRERLREAVDFVEKFDGAAQGRLRGMLNAAQVETCTEALLRAGKEAARGLNVPIHTHAGGNLVEFQRIVEEHRKTPVRFLADIGFLDDRALIGHGVFTTAHPWTHYPFGDDVRVLAERGATIGHCPYKYAKMAMTLHSFQRCVDAGVTVALGTDTYPMDIVSELRWASVLTRVTDGNYQAGQARDVFNAATLGGCRFLRRDDLGRLAPGAKADILVIDLEHLGAGVYADPIKALVDAGTGRDVRTVIVDGQVLVQDGRLTRVDEAEVYAKAREATRHYWSNVATWRWDGAGVERIVPPTFPVHRAGGEAPARRASVS
jgi:cytosine/adenosine deaminase-related metal-dependent hydrolase